MSVTICGICEPHFYEPAAHLTRQDHAASRRVYLRNKPRDLCVFMVYLVNHLIGPQTCLPVGRARRTTTNTKDSHHYKAAYENYKSLSSLALSSL